ncbi:sphingomyelin phosphodiesterase 5 [Chelydra serpentina]|uniref:sphingomyelin phosphodiesterase n=1 Tax=Chelydra serpentina TaxID=8475 RepID=A0A8T1RXR9_CHESE|nr:sphingomyelin phosphodiesterase 5 [Chelydra serpentina]
MSVRISVPNRLLSGLYSLAQRLLFPSYWAADRLLSLLECCSCCSQHRCYHCCSPWGLLTGPWLLLLLLLSMPVALLGLLLWLPLQAARRPFAYKHTKLSRPPELWELPGKGRAFSFVSANVCLLPDGLATFSNLGQMVPVACTRQALTQGEASAGSASTRSSHPLPPTKYGHQFQPTAAGERCPPDPACDRGPRQEGRGVPGDLGALPPRGLVCPGGVRPAGGRPPLPAAEPRLRAHRVRRGLLRAAGLFCPQALQQRAPPGQPLPRAGRPVPLLPQRHRRGRAVCQGAALRAGAAGTAQAHDCGVPERHHLHAPAADALIRCNQLTKGLSWVRLFQDAHAQRGDVVAFDVFCGDFNFDNCSAGDELEQTHDIFHQYQDPCRVGPRQDKPWAIGTLLNYLQIHEEAVSTPENMKRTLEQEEGRRTYLACPILQDGRPDPSAAGSPWEGRRIDYILYREHCAPISLTTEVEKFSFITQLADCSDHVAVGLQLLLNHAPQ